MPGWSEFEGAAPELAEAGRRRLVGADGVAQRFAYSAAGRVLSMATPAPGSWTATYGDHGDVVAVTDGVGATVGFTHDTAGRIVAMTAPDGKIRIPLNEESKKGQGQIEEFLMAYNGEGIQHIALICDDLFSCWDKLEARGVEFMTAPPDAYYEMSRQRVKDHEEPLDQMRKHGILIDGEGVVDGGTTRILLQIFSKTVIGPIFFEFIQRKGDDGFGEGNFKALFESIEADQFARGTLKAS